MWAQFFLENIHFTVYLFASLTSFAVVLLYFEAWWKRKTAKEGLKIAGFSVLSASFLAQAVIMESTILPIPLLGTALATIFVITRASGYFLILISLIIDPVQPKPAYVFLGSGKFAFSPLLGLPFLAAAVCVLYFYQVRVGLERQLKSMGYGFIFLTLSETFGLAVLAQATTDLAVYQIVRPFGPVWVLQHLAVLAGAIVIARWVFFYLLKRFQTQLYMIFTFLTIIVFLITTMTFTALLVQSVESESLRQLDSNTKVLRVAIDSQKAQALSDAEVVAQNPAVIAAVQSRNKQSLSDTAQAFLLTKKETLLVIVGDTGQVLARGEDKERIGDSLSADNLIRRALSGEPASSLVSSEGVLAPQLSLRASAPIQAGGQTIGAVLVGSSLNNQFLLQMKESTGLSASLYSQNQLAATTLTDSQGQFLTGLKETNPAINQKVLKEGSSFRGETAVNSSPYFGSYLPLSDSDNNVIGMIFVGEPQVGILQTAGRSIEFTFIITSLLIVLASLPSFLISRSIARQLL